MAMIEIWIPEALIVFFLALPLFRPFVKTLWPLDGLVWLPLVALGITIGVFLAYGFRSECVPILIFALIYNFANLFPFLASIASRSNDSFRDQGVLPTMLAIILLSAAAFPMFAFSSRVFEPPEGEVQAPKVLKISNRTMGSSGVVNREYSVLVYEAAQPGKPVIFIVPPEIGSTASVHLVCTELQKKDFTVVTYFFREYNNQQVKKDERNFISPAKLLRYGRIFSGGTSFVSANGQGKILEAERRTEIEFLLPRLPALLNSLGEEPPLFLLAGYGSGGSALAYLAGEDSFIFNHSNVLGATAIESRLWSAYLPEDRKVLNVPAYAGIIMRQWPRIVNSFYSLLPQKVSRTGSLPGAGLPVLYLVSGRALDFEGQKTYQAVFDTLHSGSEPLVRVALAAIEEAGPLDYQDYPFTHPIYSVILPGLKSAERDVPLVRDPIGDTAGILGNFAFFLQEQAEQITEQIAAEDPEAAQGNVSRETFRYPISGTLYVESRGMPDFGLVP